MGDTLKTYAIRLRLTPWLASNRTDPHWQVSPDPIGVVPESMAENTNVTDSAALVEVRNMSERSSLYHVSNQDSGQYGLPLAVDEGSASAGHNDENVQLSRPATSTIEDSVQTRLER
eukprot:TRINITY_DN72174_c0_g1_i1.p2 TRINITY_DN72174_c0_g1~~TRINITY_DN72174_c0_g1_i1.p2  ORF type:complete len:132 (+),score=10.31 TRINITY_DN72174_c0_g1_i1:46-396(+)